MTSPVRYKHVLWIWKQPFNSFGKGTSKESRSGIRFAQTATNSSVSSPHNHTILPKLELKKFYGNHIDWYPFWESFESAVHRNSTPFEVDKFNYLKSLLGGSAALVIAGLTLTNASYEKAIDLLKQRLEIVNSLFRATWKLSLKFRE